VVGFEPDGGTDTTARIVAPALGELLGQQVVVENRAGAGGNIAVDYVAKQAPDGYTLVLANVGALAVNPHILKTPYDPLKDLAPISMAAVFANVLVVQPSLPVKNVQDFVTLAKQKPGMTYASSGIGGAGHLAGELLKGMAQIDITHVPYKGGGPAMQGFLGGQVDAFFATPISSISQIRAGKARAIATTGSKRAALMPDVPTVAESGFRGGATGTLGTVIATAETWRMQVFGSRGWAEVGDVEHLTTWQLRVATIDPADVTRKRRPEVLTFPTTSTERAELEHFARAVAERRPLAQVDGDEVHNVAVLEAIVRSAREDRRISVPLEP